MPHLNFLVAAVNRLVKLCCFGFILLHIWTMILAYRTSGAVGGTLSAVLIGVADLYWAGMCWKHHGFLNVYTLTVTIIITTLVTASLLAKISKRKMLASIREPTK
jgi:hypothetical protein